MAKKEKQGKLLIVDDNKSILIALKLLLSSYFETVTTLNSPNNLLSTLREENFDVVLLDMNFSAGVNNGNEGLYWLEQLRNAAPYVQVVLFTAYADIDLAVKGIKAGAADFVVKPWDNAKLIATLQSVYRLSRSRREVKRLQEIKREFQAEPRAMYWGESRAMNDLRQLIEKVARTDANILITGENGTGKEMLAREIHRLSPRRDEALMCVDMGAITETLFESELFGHVKGAFTDARTDRAGKFEAASGGTLFLDEIGNLTYALQSKLLTVIQNRKVVRVGSNTPLPIDIRLICATNRNLQQMVNDGEFREDLLYRINTIHLELPALRQRKSDIVPLAERFLHQYGDLYNKLNLRFSEEAEKKLTSLPWYGNIRELQHAIEKAVILSDGGMISAEDIDGGNQQKKEKPLEEVQTLDEMESRMIEKTIRECEGNLSVVAARLGISRQTLYNKIKRYGL